MARISTVTTAMIVLFVILSLPFLLALLPTTITEHTNFSIYNSGYGGTTAFRDLVETTAADMGQFLKVKTLIGSADSLNRIAGATGSEIGSLVILGPSVPYNIDEALAVMLYVLKGGRVIIADDFGTGNDVLAMFNLLLSSLGDMGDMFSGNAFGLPVGEGITIPNPIVGLAFNNSLLVDTENFVKTSVQPLVKASVDSAEELTFNIPAPWNAQLTKGVTQGVLCNYATTLSMKVRYPDPVTGKNITKWVPAGDFPAEIEELYGIDLGEEFHFKLKIAALYSSQKAWQESNLIAAKNPNKISPDVGEWGNYEFPVALHLPLGVPDPTTGLDGSLTLISDPSIFTNQMIEDKPAYAETNIYDNKQFATNIIEMMLLNRGGNSDEPVHIYFDEGHLAHTITSPILYFGSFFRWLSMMSMMPIFAPFLPITVYGLVKKLRPKEARGRAMLMTKVEQQAGRSYFVVKMRFFVEYRQYTEGLRLIYFRTKRRINKRYQMEEQWSPATAARYVNDEFKTAFDVNTLTRDLEAIEDIIIHRVPLTEEEFLSHYLTLKDINDRIA